MLGDNSANHGTVSQCLLPQREEESADYGESSRPRPQIVSQL